jgi:hypothetical protein
MDCHQADAAGTKLLNPSRWEDLVRSQLMTALLTQMDSSKGIDKVFNNTRNAVRAATQGQQIPAVSSKLTESVNLWPARSGAPVSAVGSAASGRRKWIFSDLQRSKVKG